jgi:hypothetical protein
MKIKIWAPDSEGEEDAEEFGLVGCGSSPAEWEIDLAVEECAEKSHDGGDWFEGEKEFLVRMPSEEKLRKYFVEISYVPAFTPRRAKGDQA